MAESAATESVAAWVEVSPDHWRLLWEGREVAGVGPIAPGQYGWWAFNADLGCIEGGGAPTREQAKSSAELAVRL